MPRNIESTRITGSMNNDVAMSPLPSSSTVKDNTDELMDLCRLLKTQQLYCSDENNAKLIKGYRNAQEMLRKNHVSHSLVRGYVLRQKNRYKEYLCNVQFRGDFTYVGKCICDYVEKCEYMERYEPAIEELKYMLLLSYFVDCELLTSIGAVSVDDD